MSSTQSLHRSPRATRTLTVVVAALSVSVALVPFAPLAGAVAPGTPQWVDIANIPRGLEGQMGGWIGGDFIMVGGHASGNQDVTTIYRYNWTTDSWINITGGNASLALGNPRAEGAGIVLGNKLFVVGGRAPSCGATGGVCGDLEIVDLFNATASVTPDAPMPTPRAGIGAAGFGDLMFVMGGRDGGTPTTGNLSNATEIYNASSHGWMQGPPLPDARSEISATLWHPGSNKIYVFGGYNATALSSGWSLDVSAGPGASWVALPAMPTARYSATAGWCGNDIIVAGGVTGGASSRARTTAVEVFSTGNSTWWNASPLPYNFSESANGHTSNGIFTMLAGSGIHGASLNRTIMFDCGGIVDPAAVANDGIGSLDGGSGGGTTPPPGPGTPGPECSGTGSRNITGLVTFSNFSSFPPDAEIEVRATNGTCVVFGTVMAGNGTVGYPFSFAGLRENSSWALDGWWDDDGDMIIDGAAEPSNDNFTGAGAGDVTLNINLFCSAFKTACATLGGGGGGGGPPPGGPTCTGTGSIAGNVTVPAPFAPGEVGVIRASGAGCTHRLNLSVANGTGTVLPYRFDNVSGSYTVESWADDNLDGNPSSGEPFCMVAGVDASLNRTDVHFDFTTCSGGGGGGPGPGPGPGAGGPIALSGLAYYNGTRANGTVNIGFGNATGGRFNMTTISTGVPAAWTVEGFFADTYGLHTWIETDGIGGPGITEPLGTLVGVAIGTQVEINVTDNMTGLNLEYLDAPPDGWPPEYLGDGGGPGGPGGPGGGCSADPGGNVTGGVFDDGGNRLFDAGVEFVNLTSNSREFTGVGPDGTYLCRLSPGNWRIEAHTPYGFAFQTFTLNASDELVINLTVSFSARPPYQRPTEFYGGTVWGNLTSGGTGVDNARVSIFRSSAPGSPPGGDGCAPRDATMNTLNTCGEEAETNSSGSFVITYLGDGTYDLFIDGDGATPQVQDQFIPGAVTVTGANNTTVLSYNVGPFAFAAPAYIRGFVNYSSSPGVFLPVAGADVSAFPQCGPGSTSCMGGFDNANATGYYEIVLAPGEYGMSARTGPAWSGPALQSANVDCFPGPGSMCVNVTASNVTWMNFTLEGGSVISGQVQDGAGNGVRSFIQAERCDPVPPGPGGPPPCDRAWGQTDFDFGSGSGSGWFNLTVAPGLWNLRFEPDRFDRPDLSTAVVDGVNVTQGVTTYVFTNLTAGGRVRGNVTAGGEPVPFVNLHASTHVPPGPPGSGPGFFAPPLAWAFTDHDGEYDMLGVAPGQYDITVEPGFGSAFMRTTLENVTVGAGTLWLDIALGSGGTIEGYVRTADGTPIGGASVDAHWQPDFEPGTPGPGPSPGDFPSTGAFGRAITDSLGFYRIGGLSNGTFGMFVNPPPGTSYTTANLDPFRDDLPDVVVDNTTVVNFTLSAGGSLRACVYGSDGTTPVPFAWVSVFSRFGGFGGGEGTRSDGCADVRGVAPGTYDLEINPPRGSDYGRTIIEDVVVTEGTTTTRSVNLTTGIRFAGRVLGPDGPDGDSDPDPLVNAFVNAWQFGEPGSGPGAMGFEQTDGLGGFNMSGLVAGRYGVHVNPGFGSALSSKFIPDLIISDGGLYNYTIILGGGGSINGTVTLGNGTPLANAWIGAWSWEGGSGAGTSTNSLGQFNLSGLSAATDYNLDVFPPHDRFDLAGYHAFPLTVVENAGTDAGVIALSAGATVNGRVIDGSGAAVTFAFVNVDVSGSFGWGMTDGGGNYSVRGFRANAGDSVSIFVQPGPGHTFVGTRATHTYAPDSSGVSTASTITVSGGVNLTGRVLRSGVGVENVDVYAWPGLPYFGPPIGGQGTSGTGGWFNISGLPSGQGWDISAQPQDGTAGKFTPYAVWTNGTTTYLEINLTSGSAGLSFHVMATTGGADITNAFVDCFDASLGFGRGNSTDSRGYANFTGLVGSGSGYECRFQAPGYQPTVRWMAATSSPTLEHVSLNTTAAVRINGTYSTGNSSSAVGYFVVVVPNGTVEGDEATGFNVTGTGGAFNVPNMPAGPRYDIKVLDTSGNVVAARYNVDILSASTFDAGTITYGNFGS